MFWSAALSCAGNLRIRGRMNHTFVTFMGHDNVWEMSGVKADELFRETLQIRGKTVKVSVESTLGASDGPYQRSGRKMIEGTVPKVLDEEGWLDFTVTLLNLCSTTTDVVWIYCKMDVKLNESVIPKEFGIRQ